jgi:hypothetical protein
MTTEEIRSLIHSMAKIPARKPNVSMKNLLKRFKLQTKDIGAELTVRLLHLSEE